jgi:hypothetical protein
MFVRVINAHTADPAALHELWTTWERALADSSDGYLGATAGVADDGTFVAVIRFASRIAANRAAADPHLSGCWDEVLRLLRDTVMQDADRTDTWNKGGSDDASFVQIRQGQSSDPARLRHLYMTEQPVRMGPHRPEVLGGLIAWHSASRFTLSAYFTSEEAARRGEKRHEFKSFFDDINAVVKDLTYIDLRHPWLSSPDPGRIQVRRQRAVSP